MARCARGSRGWGSDHQAVAAAARLGSTSDHLADAPGAESASVTPRDVLRGRRGGFDDPASGPGGGRHPHRARRRRGRRRCDPQPSEEEGLKGHARRHRPSRHSRSLRSSRPTVRRRSRPPWRGSWACHHALARPRSGVGSFVETVSLRRWCSGAHLCKRLCRAAHRCRHRSQRRGQGRRAAPTRLGMVASRGTARRRVDASGSRSWRVGQRDHVGQGGGFAPRRGMARVVDATGHLPTPRRVRLPREHARERFCSRLWHCAGRRLERRDDRCGRHA
jgi:hypothetical protein